MPDSTPDRQSAPLSEPLPRVSVNRSITRSVTHPVTPFAAGPGAANGAMSGATANAKADAKTSAKANTTAAHEASTQADFSGLCTIQVLARAMHLLDALAQHMAPVSLKVLAQQTGLHASTAHRILNDLAVGRYVERVDSGTYQLGLRMLELGSLVKERLNVRTVALDYMQELHKLTGQTINLAVQQGDEIVYVERAWSERSGMQVVRSVGGRAPLHLTSTGKLFLSVSDARQIRAYAMRTGLTGTTRNSITQLEQLERDLTLIRHRGYARDNEELELGVRCMAAGIYDDSGSLQAGLSISAPSERLRDEWIAVLQYVAGQISAALGYAGQPHSSPAASGAK